MAILDRDDVVTPASAWLRSALLVVGVVTGLRLVALWFAKIDLFVDEAQYWLWGQSLDFGYYSKPPLIAWVIRATTELLGSDAPFAVRAAGPVLHGATALILGAAAARLGGAGPALATVAVYLLAPFASLGSILISTDTVMAPFYALALWGVLIAAKRRDARLAFAAGLAVGVAFLGKYAAIYLLPGLALAALVSPAFRIGWRGALALGAGFLLAAAPNLLWNLAHDLTTVSHTMDNAGWVRTGARWSVGNLAEFLAAQLAVFGPIAFGALVVAGFRRRAPGLLVLVAVPLVVVSAQALLDRAYANWALAAYFPGAILAGMVLRGWLLRASVALGAVVAVVLPVLAILAPWPLRDGEPLLARWLGRAAFSDEVLAAAGDADLPVYAEVRDVLADLHYTGRDAGIPIYAPKPAGRAMNFYEQTLSLPAGQRGDVLAVLDRPPVCGDVPVAAVGRPDTAGGAYAGRDLGLYVVPADCLLAR